MTSAPPGRGEAVRIKVSFLAGGVSFGEGVVGEVSADQNGTRPIRWAGTGGLWLDIPGIRPRVYFGLDEFEPASSRGVDAPDMEAKHND